MLDTAILKKTALFRGFREEELPEILSFLRAETRFYEKDAFIFRMGDTTDRMGLVLSGSVRIENSDYWGNRTILSHVAAGQFFAETYAFLRTEALMVDVAANEKSEILLLAAGDLAGAQADSSPFSRRLTLNLLSISMHKNLALSRRSFHTAPKTIRGRVMAYLNHAAHRSHSRQFEIPFDRQQLADYLNVERSALSKELSKMREDGLITYRKNRFSITASGRDSAR